jgi:hypothetical protein
MYPINPSLDFAEISYQRLSLICTSLFRFLSKFKKNAVSNFMYYIIGVKLNRYNDWLQAGWPGFDSQQEQEIFLYSSVQTSSGALPASHPMVLGAHPQE